MTSVVVPGVVVSDAPPESEEWFAARRGGITGTDLPKILGLSKYGNALSVWLDKRGELADASADAAEAAHWGHLLEEPVAQEWASREAVSVSRVGVVAHLEEPWIRASLDRLVTGCLDADVCGLEVKTRSAFKAAEWRDGIPDDVLAQVAWGRLTTGLPHMHIAALIGGQRLVDYRYDPDPQLEGYLLEQARPVWEAVESGVPPVAHPDGEGVLLDLLDRLYERREGDRELDPETAGPLLAKYRRGLALGRRADRLKTEAKSALVQLLDDGEAGLLDGAPAFTYRAPAPGYTIPAAELRRLREEKPTTWDRLVREGFVTETSPRPRFDLKKPTTPKE